MNECLLISIFHAIILVHEHYNMHTVTFFWSEPFCFSSPKIEIEIHSPAIVKAVS